VTTQLPLLSPTAVKGAVISACGLYRYVLTRIWAPGPLLLYLLVNPSKADAEDDDPSVKSMMRIARALGYAGVIVVNLFAWRSPDVRELLIAADPIGPENDAHITREIARAAMVICGWGAKTAKLGTLVDTRAAAVLDRVCAQREVYALRLTDNGSPEHPLFLPSTVKPLLYRRRS
jgi:hypothetical protein